MPRGPLHAQHAGARRQGGFAFSFEDSRLSEEQKRDILDIFSALGQCFEVPESRFTAFTSLIGAGPAYLFDLMEGMVQAGVTLGFQHADCRRMVAALFEGCGRMALENSDTHLMALRDNVCSPAGRPLSASTAWMRTASPGNWPRLSSRPTAAAKRWRDSFLPEAGCFLLKRKGPDPPGSGPFPFYMADSCSIRYCLPVRRERSFQNGLQCSAAPDRGLPCAENLL